jgi:hypothetical protein
MKLKFNKNWLNQPTPNAYFKTLESLIEPKPLPSQPKTNPLKPQGK